MVTITERHTLFKRPRKTNHGLPLTSIDISKAFILNAQGTSQKS